MTVKIDPSWNKELAEEWNKPYFANLTEFVKQEYATKQVFPPGSQIFAAFDATPFDKVKVVIIGQDPYHEPGQAHGLCFSVNDGVPFPPSLQNIFKEINADTGYHKNLQKYFFFLRPKLFAPEQKSDKTNSNRNSQYPKQRSHT